MSNLDKLLGDAKAKALACVGETDFTFDNDQIISAFGEIEKIMLEVAAVAATQAEAQAEAEAEAANEWFDLVDQTFESCPSRFLWMRGKVLLMVIVSTQKTSAKAEVEFSRQLAPLGEIFRFCDSETVNDREVFYTSIGVKALGLSKHLDAVKYGGIKFKLSAGLTEALEEG